MRSWNDGVARRVQHWVAGLTYGAALLLCMLLGPACPRGGETVAAREFPQHVAYVNGAIRPNHLAQNTLDNDVRHAYDRWKANYLKRELGGLYRVKLDRPDNSPTVSEGQGYGMILVAYLAGHDDQAQEIFDGLFRYFRRHPSREDERLMDWHVPASGLPEGADDDSAFDGDADIAYALLLADAQWGSAGEVNYASEASRLIAGILASTIGPNTRLPLLGDWVDPSSAELPNEHSPRSSDFMLLNFRAFGAHTGDAVWNEVRAACEAAVEQVQNDFSPDTGLLPDFLVPRAGGGLEPAPANFLEAESDGAYAYNAVRDPWRIGSDALLFENPVTKEQALRISRWAETETGGDPAVFGAMHALDGTQLPGGDFFTSIFVATLGVAAMNGDQQEWLNDLYDAVRATEEGYYEDSVTLLSMIVMSGNWWMP